MPIIMRKTSLKIQMLAGNSFISRPDSDSQKKLPLVRVIMQIEENNWAKNRHTAGTQSVKNFVNNVQPVNCLKCENCNSLKNTYTKVNLNSLKLQM